MSDLIYANYASACNSMNTATAATPPAIANLKLRWTTEQIMAHPWMESIEVCHVMDKPKHVHVNVRRIIGSHAS